MHSSLLGVFALLSLNFGPHDETFEHTHKSRSAVYASGVFYETSQRAKAPWPVKVLSIGHTMASYQQYGVGEAYFHHGLDIRADEGAAVIASRGGKVVNVENYVAGNPQYWEVAVLDADGFLWQYHHVDRNSIPDEVLSAFKTGKEIADGTKIGSVVYWPVVTFGERFHHIHLNILGKNKEFLNPFEFLEPLADNDSPEIHEIGLLKNGKKVTGNKVTGNYSVYADVRDLILSKVFVVPPTSIEVQVDNEAPFTVWKFNKLPGGSDENKFVSQFYVSSLVCGNYQCRKPIVDLSFKTTPQQIFPLGGGSHTVTLRVLDDVGNSAVKDFTYSAE